MGKYQTMSRKHKERKKAQKDLKSLIGMLEEHDLNDAEKLVLMGMRNKSKLMENDAYIILGLLHKYGLIKLIPYKSTKNRLGKKPIFGMID